MNVNMLHFLRRNRGFRSFRFFNMLQTHIAIPIALAVLLSSSVFAQTASIDSSIVGTVTDPGGAAAPGAVIMVTTPLKGISYSATTNGISLNPCFFTVRL
jgi:hypothetical protein